MATRKTVEIKVPSGKALPKTLGAAVDLLYLRRQERIQKEREVEEVIKRLKDLEAEASDHISALLQSQGLTSARGELATATIVPKQVPVVEDWDAFYAFMFKQKDGAMLQKRLAVTHIRELLEERKTLPGVTVNVINDLSLTKAAKSGV